MPTRTGVPTVANQARQALMPLAVFAKRRTSSAWATSNHRAEISTPNVWMVITCLQRGRRLAKERTDPSGHPGACRLGRLGYRPTWTRPRLRTRDKLFWVVVRALRRDWRRHLILVRPESVIRWHRQAWRFFWRWRSRAPLGRPRLSAEVRHLIARMVRDNPRWGSERIRGELLKLGLVASKRSIQRYRRRGPAHPASQTWRTFLTNHATTCGQLICSRYLRSRSRRCTSWSS